MLKKVIQKSLQNLRKQIIKLTELQGSNSDFSLKKIGYNKKTMSDATPGVASEIIEDSHPGQKRPATISTDVDSKRIKGDKDTQKSCGSQGDVGYIPFKRKKFAMMLVYCGKDYMGMQFNPGASTIEKELFKAFAKAGVVRPDDIEEPGPRVKTDYVDNPVEKINTELPPEIRILGAKRVTQGFCSKNHCSSRSYSYLLPTFAFAPVEEFVQESYRAPDGALLRVQEVLSKFKGTHNFHNFTSGKKPTDASAKRYIMDFVIDEPFVKDGLEWALIRVQGQSFMLHQIRKMIGLTIAIIRGYASDKNLQLSWGHHKCDIPRAPGLGLVLEKVHYDYYNKRYKDHANLDLNEYKDAIAKFKEDHIYRTIIETEKIERSMIKWMSSLHLHQFDYSKPLEHSDRERSAFALAQGQINLLREKKEKDQEASEGDVGIIEDNENTKIDLSVKHTDSLNEQIIDSCKDSYKDDSTASDSAVASEKVTA